MLELKSEKILKYSFIHLKIMTCSLYVNIDNILYKNSNTVQNIKKLVRRVLLLYIFRNLLNVWLKR